MRDEARRAMLLKILAAVSSAPIAVTALAGACGGQVDVGEQDASTDAAPREKASWVGSFGSSSPTATTPARPRDPTTPANCVEPLFDLSNETRARCEVDSGHYNAMPVCFPLPEDGGSCESRYSEECALWGYGCGLSQRGEAVDCLLPVANACCWQVSGDCFVGRPFLVDGRALVAPLLGDGTWSLAERTPASLEAFAADLDPATRAAIADVWSRDGLSEHASVASFARFILELLALGAPADLVTRAQRALAEEITHAERSFTLATLYAGAPRGPGALDVSGALAQPMSLAAFAARTAAEGCIAETVAALQLRAAADAAREPALGALLQETAEEESDHAVLAWRAVRWAIEEGGAPVRQAVSAVFARASPHVGFGPCADDAMDEALLRAHGVLSRRERHDLAVAALGSVIAPAAEQLLSLTYSSPAHAS
jgi:hypothetical protein